jgi:2-polyprenyl-6-methoxyphenol hydroxylase-like FAD-dependent oxidoreductase
VFHTKRSLGNLADGIYCRCGYSLNFINRRSLLQSLDRSVSEKEKILVRKRVSRVDFNQDRIVAQCKDGTSYEGAVIVAADGVHSMVRQEMWRHMDLKMPGMISDAERHSEYEFKMICLRLTLTELTAEYSCIYGISKPVKHLRQGVFYRTYGEDLSFLTTLGKNKEVFWFVFQKLDRKYTVPNIPRFTKQDAEAQAEKLFSQPITDQVSFQDIWEQRESYLLAPLEEALYSNWTWERFACIGDSAHKVSQHCGGELCDMLFADK